MMGYNSKLEHKEISRDKVQRALDLVEEAFKKKQLQGIDIKVQSIDNDLNALFPTVENNSEIEIKFYIRKRDC